MNENYTTDTIEKTKQTRGDRIRSMTDEELAWELLEWRFDARAKAEGSERCLPDTQKTICEWLKRTVV